MNIENRIVKSGTLRRLEVLEKLTGVVEDMVEGIQKVAIASKEEVIGISASVQAIAHSIGTLTTSDTGLVVNGDGITITNCSFEGLDTGLRIEATKEGRVENYHDPEYDEDDLDSEDIQEAKEGSCNLGNLDDLVSFNEPGTLNVDSMYEKAKEEHRTHNECMLGALKRSATGYSDLDDFGIKGDSITDDTDAVCDAMNDADNTPVLRVGQGWEYKNFRIKPEGTIANVGDQIIINTDTHSVLGKDTIVEVIQKLEQLGCVIVNIPEGSESDKCSVSLSQFYILV